MFVFTLHSYANSRFTAMHSTMPKIVGRSMENRAHFPLPVSRLIVRKVVLQGQCMRAKMIKHTAVFTVQPLLIKI